MRENSAERGGFVQQHCFAFVSHDFTDAAPSRGWKVQKVVMRTTVAQTSIKGSS